MCILWKQVWGGYAEYDLKDAESFYGRTKALGELDDKKNVTIRSSIVGPDLNVDGIGLLNWFMKQREVVNGYEKVWWTGQTTLQYAKTVEEVAKERVHGTYNLVPDTSISKYDLLRLFNRYLRNDSLKVIPCDTPISDKSLKRTRYDFNYSVPDYEKMIAELSKWIRNHKELYPHYELD